MITTQTAPFFIYSLSFIYCYIRFFHFKTFKIQKKKDFKAKYLRINNIHLSNILIKSWLSLSHVESLNLNQLVKFSDF